MPPNAPGWTYYDSESLGMRYAVRETPIGPEVMTADKVRYSASEIKVLNAGGLSVSKEIHNVKRLFDGVVVDAARSVIT